MVTKTTRNKLREIRQQKRISLTQAATETRISRGTLRAIEAGLPTGLSETYEDGIISTYQRYLGLETHPSPTRRKRDVRKHFRRQQVYATSDLLKRSTFLIIALGILAYALWQSWQLVKPPQLSIVEPPRDLITTESSIKLKGRTSADANLYLNDQPVLVEADGSFTIDLPLRSGLNEINLVSINSFGRRAEATRSVVFDPLTD